MILIVLTELLNYHLHPLKKNLKNPSFFTREGPSASVQSLSP